MIRYFKLSKPFYKAQREADDALARSWAEALELCEAFKPKDATDQQLIEWCSFLRQLTARKAQKAEPATVKNVVRTVTDLYQFQLIRGRAAGLADVDLINLSSFLTDGTSAPSRALPALCWFSKHAALDWALGDLVAPERSRRTEPGEHQAVAAFPFMATELESRIVHAHSRSDPIWMPLLGAWLVTFGCIRYAHLDRSSVRHMTESTVHCRCGKGKQAAKRDGFDWAVPAKFACGWNWAVAWRAAFCEVPSYRMKRCGLVFDHLGHTWSRSDTQKACQQSLNGEIEGAEHPTTYSWRRFGPTLALLLQWEPHMLLALGDWMDKVGQNTGYRHAASKYTLSPRTKHTVLSCAKSLGQYKSGEEIAPEVLRDMPVFGFGQE